MNSLLEVLSNLISAKDRYPSSAYEFAAVPWHYDHSDHPMPT
jgi:hypothetical protein